MTNPITYIRDLVAYIPAKIAYERGFYEGGKLRGANQDFKNANTPFEDTASPDRDVLRAPRALDAEFTIVASAVDGDRHRAVVGGVAEVPRNAEIACTTAIGGLLDHQSLTVPL